MSIKRRRHLAEHGYHIAERAEKRAALRRKLEAREKERQSDRNRQHCRIDKYFFYAEILFIARYYRAHERPTDEIHRQEVHHRISRNIRRIGENRFEKRHSEERAVRHRSRHGSYTVADVLLFFAEYKKEKTYKQKLRGGYYPEKYQKVYAKLSREIGFSERIKRERGLAHIHERFGKRRNAFGFYRLGLYEYETGHRDEKHDTDGHQCYQKGLHSYYVIAPIEK